MCFKFYSKVNHILHIDKQTLQKDWYILLLNCFSSKKKTQLIFFVTLLLYLY